MPAPVDVLLIEDSPELRSVLSSFLRSEGLRVAEASHGLDGLRLIRELMPGLVLCNLALPAMDGLAIWRSSQETCRRAGTAFVLTSDSPPLNQLPRGVVYLPKPFDLGELLELARRAASSAPATSDRARRPKARS